LNHIRVLLADDHDVVRTGIRAILQAHAKFEICGEAGDGREAVELAEKLKPDVVVIDVNMPILNGVEAARKIIAALPRVEVLFLTANHSEDVARSALLAGARGYVVKTDAARELVAAVESVSAHRPYLTASVSNLVLSGFLGRARGAPTGATDGGASLTQREREVLQLIAEGRSNKEVATALGIGIKTVETHRANVMAKLGLQSVADLVRYAIRNGIIAA
jgi:DNA-binding NarL/FixJ family response regulator